MNSSNDMELSLFETVEVCDDKTCGPHCCLRTGRPP